MPLIPKLLNVARPETVVAVVVPTSVAPVDTVAVTTAACDVMRLPLESTTATAG